MIHRLTGRCHCGKVTVTFETTTDPNALQLRACDCSFCRKHSGLTVSDPNGKLVFRAADPAKLTRYRFGTKTADFLLCAVCGVYLGVHMELDGQGYGVLNINALDDRTPFDRPPEPTHLGGEEVGDRLARRKGRWTPAEVVGG
jgi:hypothetical protein